MGEIRPKKCEGREPTKDQLAVYDTSRVFSSGCSMGSAFSIFISNCLYGSLPKGHITAFATHSTGIKKKVRNLLTAKLGKSALFET